jgi:hypothetical protein
MPTPRFRDLSPAAAASVVSAFLGGESSAEFTEKLAGQHLTATSKTGGRWHFSIKTGESGSGGFFPEVEYALNKFHPKSNVPLTYQFEIVNRRDRPDYIDYDLKSDAAVEYTGVMTPDVAATLNAKQKSVKFLTKSDISKPVGSLAGDPETKTALKKFVSDAKKATKMPKARMLEIESLLMDLIDKGKIPSSLGGPRIEGLFGTSEGTGFKIPSKAYSELQLQQARFYAIVRSYKVRETLKRFKDAVKNPEGDRVVSDVLDYIDKLAAGGPGPGFRVFFSPEEARRLQPLSTKYREGNAQSGVRLAQTLFDRITDRVSWASSGVQEAAEISSRNKTHIPSSDNRENAETLREWIRLSLTSRKITKEN